MERPEQRRRLRIGLAIFGAALSLSVLVPAAAYFYISPPPGPIVASRDIASGAPFELTYTSDGAEARVWLDMTCDRCSLPVDGELTVTSGSERVHAVEISAGDSEANDLTHHQTLEQQPLTTIPASPRGTVLVVRGTLTVSAERGLLSSSPREDATPLVHLLRVSIAR